MKTSSKQDFVIDTLLSTHRELTAVDLVDYKMHSMAAGGIILIIKSNDYFFSYKILASGAITENKKSKNGISFFKLKYFSN